VQRSATLVLAELENVIWLVLYAAGIAGLAVAIRRRDALLAFPIVVSAGLVLVSALSQGNVGTAFRHRGQVAWSVALLAALGGEHLTSAIAARRSRR
jgi:hypothetical protein